jgi:biotin carboxylase
MTQQILLLGGKGRLVPAVHKARQLGLCVIVADGNPEAPALAAADRGFCCDISNDEKILQLAKREGVDGVLSLSEFGVVSAARVSEELGLPGIPVESARNVTDKFRMRSVWQDNALPQPAFRLVRGLSDAMSAVEELGLPVICKPCWSSASRGVSRVRRADELANAAQQALVHDRTGRALVECDVTGDELSCEGFLLNGKFYLLSVADKTVERTGRTCITWTLTYPSQRSDLTTQLESLLQRATESLGVRSGCCHAELIVNQDDSYLLELAARGGGGHIYTTIVEYVSGFDLLSASIKLAMGWSVEVQRTRSRAACYRFLRIPAGRLTAIRGLGEARDVPWIHEIDFCVQPGDDIAPTRDGATRPGWIVALGPSQEIVVTAAGKAAELLQFDVQSTEYSETTNVIDH